MLFARTMIILLYVLTHILINVVICNHCRLRNLKESICFYSYHDVLSPVKKCNILKLETSTDKPFLKDCSTMAYEYFKGDEINETKMNEFCYDYSFCDDI